MGNAVRQSDFPPHDATQGRTRLLCPWLLLFCASVSWRVLVYLMEGKHLDHVPAALLPSVARTGYVARNDYGMALARSREGNVRDTLPGGRPQSWDEDLLR